MPAVRTTLTVAERDRKWQSNRNGATYRWNEDLLLGTWEVLTTVADWHPVRPGGVRTVYAQAGERFVETTS